MKRLVIDLDGTICRTEDNGQGDDPVGRYRQATPIPSVIEKLRDYQALGFQIAIFTARNMRTFAGDVGKITAQTLPVIIDWLDRHQVPYDEVIVGKPWCGHEGFYVDDRAVRPQEFVTKSPSEIAAILEADDLAHR